MGLFRKTLKTYNLRNVTFEKVGKGIFSKLFSRKYKIVEIDGKEAKPTNDLYDAADLRGDFYRRFNLFSIDDKDSVYLKKTIREKMPTEKTDFSKTIYDPKSDLKKRRERYGDFYNEWRENRNLVPVS